MRNEEREVRGRQTFALEGAAVLEGSLLPLELQPQYVLATKRLLEEPV